MAKKKCSLEQIVSQLPGNRLGHQERRVEHSPARIGHVLDVKGHAFGLLHCLNMETE